MLSSANDFVPPPTPLFPTAGPLSLFLSPEEMNVCVLVLCMDQVSLFRNADRGRLLVSMAESALIRNSLRPVTVPLKIAMACQLVIWAKPGVQPPSSE